MFQLHTQQLVSWQVEQQYKSTPKGSTSVFKCVNREKEEREELNIDSNKFSPWNKLIYPAQSCVEPREEQWV